MRKVSHKLNPNTKFHFQIALITLYQAENLSNCTATYIVSQQRKEKNFNGI